MHINKGTINLLNQNKNKNKNKNKKQKQNQNCGTNRNEIKKGFNFEEDF